MSSKNPPQKIVMPPEPNDPDGQPFHVYLEVDGAMTFWRKFATKEEALRAQVEFKRRVLRVRANLDPVRWGDTSDCPLTARITSLSRQGCFLQTAERSDAGTTVFVNLSLFATDAPAANATRTVRCEVRYCLDNIGLGLVFHDLSTADTSTLDRLIDRLAAEQEGSS